jgi:ADP-glucose pyrophosphorylase
MEERINDLFELFFNDGDPVGYVTGREIIEKMGLANKEYLQAYDIRSYCNNTPEIEEFFQYFRNILETNPGYEVASAIWIDNHYGLRLEWQREIKLRTLLDK